MSIPELAEVLNGRVMSPDDDGYDDARALFYGGLDRRPAVIVRVADETDVARVIGYARRHELELAVRGGGHSNAGHSTTEGGIVLDLKDMKAIDIDVEGRTAWAQTGLTAFEFSWRWERTGLRSGSGTPARWGSGASRSVAGWDCSSASTG
jgi:FAD/FMN-containing dehydrogenase